MNAYHPRRAAGRAGADREAGRAFWMALGVAVPAALLIAWIAFGRTSHAQTPDGAGAAESVQAPEEAKVPEALKGKPPEGVTKDKVYPFTPKRIVDPEKGKGMVLYPDGSYLPPLNGAKNPPPAQWHIGEFTPVVGMTRRFADELGWVEYYVHEDGSESTTIMGPGIEDGKPKTLTVTVVNHPTPEGEQPPTTGGIGEEGGKGGDKDAGGKDAGGGAIPPDGNKGGK